MAKPTEKRNFTRAEVRVVAELHIEEGPSLPGEVQDVSLKGALISCEGDVGPGAVCALSIRLHPDDPAYRVDAKGTIRRVSGSNVAIEFDTVEAEGFEHLRNLVLYNTQDVEQVEDEFEQSIGIKRVQDDF